MDVEFTDDLQARRLQSLLTELRPPWMPAEVCALLLDLSHGAHEEAAEPSRSKTRGFKHGTPSSHHTWKLAGRVERFPRVNDVQQVLSVAGVLTTPAPVQAAKDSVAEQLRVWDPDSDGTVDMAEASKAATAKFESLDADHDGTLDMKEMKPTRVDKKTFKQADPDQDGTLSKDEYMTIVQMRFKSADPDNDGTVALAELKTRAGQGLARQLQ